MIRHCFVCQWTERLLYTMKIRKYGIGYLLRWRFISQAPKLIESGWDWFDHLIQRLFHFIWSSPFAYSSIQKFSYLAFRWITDTSKFLLLLYQPRQGYLAVITTFSLHYHPRCFDTFYKEHRLLIDSIVVTHILAKSIYYVYIPKHHSGLNHLKFQLQISYISKVFSHKFNLPWTHAFLVGEIFALDIL